MFHAANMDCPPHEWPESPRNVVTCAPLTRNGPNHLTQVMYPLTRKREKDGWIHTPTHSYRNPFNAAVGGKMVRI